MDEYTKRHGRKALSSSKPTCFGDLEFYDSRDDTCQECPVRRSCKVIVEKKMRSDSKEIRETRLRPGGRRRSSSEEAVNLRRKRKRKNEAQRVDPMIGDSWWVALLYNSLLGATKAMLVEAHFGVDSIPLSDYPNPFLLLTKEDDE